MNRMGLAGVAFAAAFISACGPLVESANLFPPASAPAPDGIHLKNLFNLPNSAVIVEYTSDNAPGQLFTEIYAGITTAATAVPVQSEPADQPSGSGIHVLHSGVHWFETSPHNLGAEITEFTSDNAPGELYTVTQRGGGVTVMATPLQTRPR